MAPRFYNTLSQRLEEFAPADGKTVRMYTCGPTVYSYAHIGNFRTFVFQDILRRTLRAHGWALNHVMNITDVDDRIIQNATEARQTIQEYTAPFTKAFLEDLATLRVERPETISPATEHIGEMVELIERLNESGHTYKSDGSVYFRIATFPEYGKLSHTNFSGNVAGARIDTDKYEKEDARDFAVWKGPKPGEPAWDTPFGAGRPGWHIECSAMAMRHLGETLDIHTGGVDLVFPHHENEIAQSEAATGKPFARFWLHSEHLLVEGQKMSKSLGNFFTLREIVEKGYTPDAVRYLLASAPYRKQLNFTFDGLKAAATSIERLRNFELRLKTSRFAEGLDPEAEARTAACAGAFDAAMDDDLNTADALGAIFEYIRDINTLIDGGSFRSGNVKGALEMLRKFDAIFDVLRPPAQEGALTDEQVNALIGQRNQARKSRDFARADAIRHELAAQGIVLEDTKDGVRWKRK
ncbi:MAG: cysteine--tRNA ligase [Bryobacterales bacterium]|nr:cysteine--tRNA ligase [Bryobacterales bacterium]